MNHCRQKQGNYQDVEAQGEENQQLQWKDWLFSNSNNFFKKLLNEQSEIGNFLRKLFLEEYGKEYAIKSNTFDDNISNQHYESRLEEAKAIFGLQSQSGKIVDHFELNCQLGLVENIEFLLLNFQKQINEEVIKSSSKILAANSNLKGLKLILEKFLHLSKFTDNFIKELFEIVMSNTGNDLPQYFLKYDFLKEEHYKKDLFYRTIQICNISSLKKQDELGLLETQITIEDFDYVVKSSDTPALNFIFEKYPDVTNFHENHVRVWFSYIVEHKDINMLNSFCSAFQKIRKMKELVEEQTKYLVLNGSGKKIACLVKHYDFLLEDEDDVLIKDFDITTTFEMIDAFDDQKERKGLRALAIRFLQVEAEQSELDKIEDFAKISVVLENVLGIYEHNWISESKLAFITSSLMKQNPEHFQNIFWQQFAKDSFQNALTEINMDEVSFWSLNYPSILEPASLMSMIDPIMQVFRTNPESFQDSAFSLFIRNTFIARARTSKYLTEDLTFLMNKFSGFEDSSMFELEQNFEVMSTILMVYPERFGGSTMSHELAKAMKESSTCLVDSYFEEFEMLSQPTIGEKMILFSLESNCNIDMIYHVLNKATGLKQTKNQFIKFLLDTDIRKESTRAEDIENANCRALVSAARYGSLELTKELLNKGVNVDQKDILLGSALHLSAYLGHKEIVHELLHHGANIELLNYYKEAIIKLLKYFFITKLI